MRTGTTNHFLTIRRKRQDMRSLDKPCPVSHKCVTVKDMPAVRLVQPEKTILQEEKNR